MKNLDKNLIERRDKFSERVGSFRQSAVILTANDLGLFEALSDRPLTLCELSGELKLPERGVSKLLLALAGMDLIQIENGMYQLAGDAELFLKEGSDYYLGDIFRHNFRLMKRWTNMDEAIRLGKSPWAGAKRKEKSDADLRSFILGMENISRTAAEEVADSLDFSNIDTILDVGGGPGTYLYTFLRRNPQAKGAILDFPRVIEIAKQQTEKQGMTDRVSYIEGDMFEADFAGPYDMIFLGNLIHSNGEDAVKNLFRKCSKALNPNGKLVVKDFYLDDTGTKPLQAALFTINMFLGTEDGSAYKWSEVEEWMREAGLKQTDKFDTARHSGVVVGRKLV